MNCIARQFLEIPAQVYHHRRASQLRNLAWSSHPNCGNLPPPGGNVPPRPRTFGNRMNSPSDSPPPPPDPRPFSGKRIQKWLWTFVKIAIAVLGIWWVAHNTSWYDTATLPANGEPLRGVTFLNDTEVTIVGEPVMPDGKQLVRIRFPSGPVDLRVDTLTKGEQECSLIIDENTVIPGTHEQLNLPHEIDIDRDHLKDGNAAGASAGQWKHEGLHSLLLRARDKWYLIVLAWLLLGTPFFVTAIRWRGLMRPQGIDMPLGKCLQLTFVGQFYSIIMPGITGGDILKIVYAARLTGSKTKSFITIILDRVIGLVALMVIAGASAGIQLLINRQRGLPQDNTLLNVFILVDVLLVALAAGSIIYFSHRLRRLVGIEWFIDNFSRLTTRAEGDTGEQAQHLQLERLVRFTNGGLLAGSLILGGLLTYLRWATAVPWARNNTLLVYGILGFLALVALAAAAGLVLHARLVDRMTPLMRKAVESIIRTDETLHVYRGHFSLLFWAFMISVLSQLTLPLSAWLSGMAFGMSDPVTHYLAYVPVAVLVASLPISPPQGFGLLDGVIYHFFVKRGAARAAQAVALAQAVRFLPILWNLLGAYWVITGKYSRHQARQENLALK